MAPMRPGDWSCAACGNHNFASRAVCNKCQGPRTDGDGGDYGAAPTNGGGMARFSPYGGPPAAKGGAMVAAAPMMTREPTPSEMKDGDWMCPSCSNHNFASRVNCNRCGVLREGMKEGDWVCRGCKTHNFAKRSTCNKCNAPQSAQVGGGGSWAMPLMAGAGAYVGYAASGAYPGYGGKGNAGMMMMAAPQAPTQPKDMKQGDWVCPSCMNHNFASRVNCNRCNALRPGMKAGDWVCRGCKNHNFASRDTCNKCEAVKVAGQ